MKRLFIGNLPYQASEAELQEWFTHGGFEAESVQIVRDKFTGQARGFGLQTSPTTRKQTALFRNATARNF